MESAVRAGRAFVTGATGGIGSALCARLSSEGWQVVALVRPSSEAWHLEQLGGLALVSGDLLDQNSLTTSMSGCDVVFHLAAIAHADSDTPYSVFQQINVDGTRAAVAAAVAARVPAFVFLSTVAVYPEGEALFDESSSVGPSTPYGATKLAGELLVLESGGKMRVTVLRLPVVYGPRDRGNVRRLIEAIAKGRFLIPGSGQNIKTAVAVENVVAAAMCVVSDFRAAGQVYIVADETAPTLSEIVAAISRGLGLNPSRARLPLRLAEIAGHFADFLRRSLGVSLPVSSEQVRKLASSTRYNGERIRRDLGFVPHVRLAEGMKSAVDGYLDSARKHGAPPSRTQ